MLSISRAVTAIKTAILQGQARTIRNANSDVLALYYAVGQYISAESRTQKWGSGAIKTISEQLRKELPGLKGFSERSIRYMRQFYEVWCNHVHQRLLLDENKCTPFLQPAAAKKSWQRLTGCAPTYVSQFSPNRVTVSMQIRTIGDKSAINDKIGDKLAENTTTDQKLSAIIEYMQKHQCVTVSEIADLLSIKSSRSRDYLRMLVDRGIVVTNGANKNRTYTLNI